LQVLGQYRRIDWLELRLSSGGEPERCGAGRCQGGEQNEQQNNLEHRASNPPCESGAECMANQAGAVTDVTRAQIRKFFGNAKDRTRCGEAWPYDL